MESYPKPLSVILILSVILALVVTPSLLDGWQQLHWANQSLAQGQYWVAAQEYGFAARRLPWRADLWERAGLASFQAGNPDETISLLLQARRREALTAQGRLTLGDAYLQLGDRSAALAEWIRLRADGLLSTELYERLARFYDGEVPNIPEALAAYQGLLQFSPRDAHAHYRLGLLLAAQDPARALNELTQAARLDPSLDSRVQVMNLALNTALQLDDPAYQAVVVGQALGFLGEWHLAMDAFQRAIRENQNYAEAWAFMGEARGHLGQDGLTELNRALTLNPASVSARVFRGLYWKAHDRLDLALIDFRVAAGLEPDNPAWLSILADTLAQSGDLSSALAGYQRAALLRPENPQYWRLLATFCIQYDFEPEIGLAAAQQAVDLSPNDPRSLDVLGWTYLHSGKPADAEQYLKKALEQAPNLASAHLHLGILYLQKGQSGSARSQLEQALALAGEDPLGQQAQQLLTQYFP
jgi:tetratricopeptide (TPR) repeat protein